MAHLSTSHFFNRAFAQQFARPAALILSATLVLSGCSAVSNLTKKDDITPTATLDAPGYYAAATAAAAKKHYKEAALQLDNLRTFYPTSPLAEQALLDLIYINYAARDYEAVIAKSTQFLQYYPSSRHADYALYARGVTNMQGSPKTGKLFKLEQADRDTAYLRLAFADFAALLTYYPNSEYAADTALRMTYIYNQFAKHELAAAYFYVKQNAYVAAANRAKWVFQYYPQSDVTPEALAILAHANDQLGLRGSANQYKTLLALNYPQYLSNGQADGDVLLPKADTSPVRRTLHAISFGKFGALKPIANTPNPDAPTDGVVRQVLTLPQAAPVQ